MASVSFKIGDITLAANTSGAVNFTVGTTHTYSLSLLALQYHKKIFKPSSVLAVVQLKDTNTSNNAMPSMSALITYFKDKAVSLSKDGTSIASDYYVYKVEPEFRRDATGMYARVTLHCFSRDHKLSLQPYSRTYVNKKLCGSTTEDSASYGGILYNELNNEAGILKSAGFTTSNCTFTDLHCLKYASAGKITDSSPTLTEFIQPYLVQYNESFYDFIARTANRCGEFVYHEGGVWHVGLTEATAKTIDSSKTLSCRYRGYASSPITTEPAYLNGMDLKRSGKFKKNEDSFYSGLTDKEKDNKKQQQEEDHPWKGLYAGALKNRNNTYFYSNELPIDEYLGIVLRKDDFADWWDEYSHGFGVWLVSTLNTIFNQTSLSKMVGQLGVPAVRATYYAGKNRDIKNDRGNSVWINNAKSEMKSSDPKDTTKPDNNKVDTVSLYGSKLSLDQKHNNYEHQLNLNAKFYQFISKCCHGVSRSLIEVEAGIENPVCGLCDVVTLGDDTCVVIEVSETLISEAGDRSAAQQGQQLVLAPKFSATVYSFTKTDSNTKEELYTTENELSFFCPPAVVPFARTSGPQHAFVRVNGDPEDYGRVCIQYPWQALTDEPSPWIRMAVPFAPSDAPNDGAGFFFEPMVGDEVLVDYDNGNIEHPIVVGTLYSRRTKAPMARKPLASGEDISEVETDEVDGKKRLINPVIQRRITSGKGHSITFNDSDSTSDFIAGMFPAVGVAKRFWSLFTGDPWNFGPNDNFTGGISLSDKWGMYKIEGSSTRRNISINSPFGDQKISAFTGITLNAPNGEINIRGKNICIEAGNEVKIVSGKNIEDKKNLDEKFWSTLGSNIWIAFSDIVTKAADLSLLRTMVEAFLKPIAGTMTIQSGRYLILKAGKGNPQIPHDGFIDNPNKKRHTFAQKREKKLQAEIQNKCNDLEAAYDDIKAKSDTIIDTMYRFYHEAYTAKSQLINTDHYDDLTYPDPNNITGREVIENTIFESQGGSDAIRFSTNYGSITRSALKGKIMAFQHKVRSARDYCKTVMDGSVIDGGSQRKLAEKNALKEIAAASLLPLKIISISQTTELYDTDPDTIDKDAKKKFMRRAWIVKFNELSNITQQSRSDVNGGTTITFNNEADYLDDNKWDTYIKLLTIKLDTSSVLGIFNRYQETIEDKFYHELPWDTWVDITERGLWDHTTEGQIIMSDKEGSYSYRFNHGALIKDEVTRLKDLRVKLRTL